MQLAIRAMVGAAALAFALAVIGSLTGPGPFLGTPPEAYSRACSNLALLAIAATLCLDGRGAPG